jgi:tetratricopeptide (TPR) repeat protein
LAFGLWTKDNAMRRLELAIAAAVLYALLAGAVMPQGGARAAADDVSERLGDCQDDETENDDRIEICTSIIDDVSLPEDLRAEALINRGIVHLDERKPKLALADFEQAIAFNPEYPAAHAYRGEAHKALEHFDKALTDYDRAVALDGSSADLYAFRGDIHRRTGALDKARADFETALRLDAEHEVAMLGMKALGIKQSRP